MTLTGRSCLRSCLRVGLPGRWALSGLLCRVAMDLCRVAQLGHGGLCWSPLHPSHSYDSPLPSFSPPRPPAYPANRPEPLAAGIRPPSWGEGLSAPWPTVGFYARAQLGGLRQPSRRRAPRATPRTPQLPLPQCPRPLEPAHRATTVPTAAPYAQPAPAYSLPLCPPNARSSPPSLPPWSARRAPLYTHRPFLTL